MIHLIYRSRPKLNGKACKEPPTVKYNKMDAV